MTARPFNGAGSALGWLEGVLWDSSDEVAVAVGRSLPAGFDPVTTSIVLPSAKRARTMVPASPRRAVRASLRRDDDAMGSWTRARRALAGVSLSTPAARLVGDRLTVGVAHGSDPAEHVFVSHLASILEAPRLVAAVAWGPARPNRKPVLRLLDPAGRTVGYAKVAWNALTAGLVTTEANALRLIAARRPETFRAPALLAEGTWQGHAFTVTAALPNAGRSRGRLNGHGFAPVLREIASMGQVSSMPFASTPYIHDLLRRSAIVGDPALASAIGRAATLSAPVRVGFAHGDWSPWNISSGRGEVSIWDWERAREGVPIGVDALHHAFLSATLIEGRSPRRAAGRLLDDVGPLLLDLHVPQPIWRALLHLYLAEFSLRAQEGRAAGIEFNGDGAAAIRSLIVDRAPTSAFGRNGWEI